MITLYNLLGVQETATEEEIKAAYRRLSLIYHPDKTGGDAEMYLKIQNAYNTLIDYNQRILYDARLRKARSEQSKQAEYERQRAAEMERQRQAEAERKRRQEEERRRQEYERQRRMREEANRRFAEEQWRKKATQDFIIEDFNPRKSEKEIFQKCVRILAVIAFSSAAIGVWLLEDDFPRKSTPADSPSVITNVSPDRGRSHSLDYVNPSNHSTVSPYAGNSLETGTAPYTDYYRNQFDNTYDNYIEVRNGNDNDAVVLLSEPITKKVIRNVYIKAGATFRIRNIPQGVFAVKYMSGKDWNPEMQVGKVKGCFEKDLSFSETSAKDYFDMRVVETYDGYSIPTYTLTLYTVRNGNLHMRELTAEQFF